MRRYMAIGGIVVTMLFTGSVSALAQSPAPDPTCAPAASEPAARRPAAARGESGKDQGRARAEPAGQVEPGQVEPGQDEPGQVEPGQDEPGQVEPAQDEPGQDEPGQDDPGQDDPAPAGGCTPADEPVGSAGEATSAAKKFNWGEPNRVEEFDGPLGDEWGIYDGPGHVGNGRRTPDAVSVADGVMTITGDSNGATAGMAWGEGQKYGRWEGRVKAPASDESYNALMLLWPDAENWPVGGEVDFMEMSDHTRQGTQMFLHYGADNNQVSGEVKIDATQWHNWAVEWTPGHIAAFVDGKEWFRTTDTSILPPGPMHLCIQLDWFPDGGDVEESYMYVDWVRQYPVDADTIEGAVEDLGGDIGKVAGAAAEGAADGARSDLVGRVTKPLVEGRPDVAPVRRGLVDRAVPTSGE